MLCIITLLYTSFQHHQHPFNPMPLSPQGQLISLCLTKTLYLHQYMSHSHQDWLVGTLYLLHISNRGQSESATIDLGPRSWFQCDTDKIGESIQFHNELFHPCRLNDNTVLNGPNHLILHAHGANSCCASLHYFILHSNTTSIHSIQCHCHNKGNWYLCAWQKTLYLHQYMSHSHQDWLVGTLYLLHISNRGQSESATIDLGPRSWFQCDTDKIGESIQFHNELFHPCRLNDNTVLNGPNHLILHAHGANSCCASLHYFILHSNTTSIHSIQCHCHNKGNWYLCAWQKTLYLHQYMSHSHQDWLVGTLYLLHISNRGRSESATIDLGPRSWFQCDTDKIGESIQFHNELFHPCRLNDNTVLNGPTTWFYMHMVPTHAVHHYITLYFIPTPPASIQSNAIVTTRAIDIFVLDKKHCIFTNTCRIHTRIGLLEPSTCCTSQTGVNRNQRPLIWVRAVDSNVIPTRLVKAFNFTMNFSTPVVSMTTPCLMAPTTWFYMHMVPTHAVHHYITLYFIPTPPASIQSNAIVTTRAIDIFVLDKKHCIFTNTCRIHTRIGLLEPSTCCTSQTGVNRNQRPLIWVRAVDSNVIPTRLVKAFNFTMNFSTPVVSMTTPCLMALTTWFYMHMVPTHAVHHYITLYFIPTPPASIQSNAIVTTRAIDIFVLDKKHCIFTNTCRIHTRIGLLEPSTCCTSQTGVNRNQRPLIWVRAVDSNVIPTRLVKAFNFTMNFSTPVVSMTTPCLMAPTTWFYMHMVPTHAVHHYITLYFIPTPPASIQSNAIVTTRAIDIFVLDKKHCIFTNTCRIHTRIGLLEPSTCCTSQTGVNRNQRPLIWVRAVDSNVIPTRLVKAFNFTMNFSTPVVSMTTPCLMALTTWFYMHMVPTHAVHHYITLYFIPTPPASIQSNAIVTTRAIDIFVLDKKHCIFTNTCRIHTRIGLLEPSTCCTSQTGVNRNQRPLIWVRAVDSNVIPTRLVKAFNFTMNFSTPVVSMTTPCLMAPTTWFYMHMVPTHAVHHYITLYFIPTPPASIQSNAIVTTRAIDIFVLDKKHCIFTNTCRIHTRIGLLEPSTCCTSQTGVNRNQRPLIWVRAVDSNVIPTRLVKAFNFTMNFSTPVVSMTTPCLMAPTTWFYMHMVPTHAVHHYITLYFIPTPPASIQSNAIVTTRAIDIFVLDKKHCIFTNTCRIHTRIGLLEPSTCCTSQTGVDRNQRPLIWVRAVDSNVIPTRLVKAFNFTMNFSTPVVSMTTPCLMAPTTWFYMHMVPTHAVHHYITLYFIPTPPASIQSNAIVTTRAIDIFVLDKKHCIFTNTCRIHTRIGLLEPSTCCTSQTGVNRNQRPLIWVRAVDSNVIPTRLVKAFNFTMNFSTPVVSMTTPCLMAPTTWFYMHMVPTHAVHHYITLYFIPTPPASIQSNAIVTTRAIDIFVLDKKHCIFTNTCRIHTRIGLLEPSTCCTSQTGVNRNQRPLIWVRAVDSNVIPTRLVKAFNFTMNFSTPVVSMTTPCLMALTTWFYMHMVPTHAVHHYITLYFIPTPPASIQSNAIVTTRAIDIFVLDKKHCIFTNTCRIHTRIGLLEPSTCCTSQTGVNRNQRPLIWVRAVDSNVIPTRLVKAFNFTMNFSTPVVSMTTPCLMALTTWFYMHMVPTHAVHHYITLYFIPTPPASIQSNAIVTTRAIDIFVLDKKHCIFTNTCRIHTRIGLLEPSTCCTSQTGVNRNQRPLIWVRAVDSNVIPTRLVKVFNFTMNFSTPVVSMTTPCLMALTTWFYMHMVPTHAVHHYITLYFIPTPPASIQSNAIVTTRAIDIFVLDKKHCIFTNTCRIHTRIGLLEPSTCCTSQTGVNRNQRPLIWVRAVDSNVIPTRLVKAFNFTMNFSTPVVSMTTPCLMAPTTWFYMHMVPTHAVHHYITLYFIPTPPASIQSNAIVTTRAIDIFVLDKKHCIFTNTCRIHTRIGLLEPSTCCTSQTGVNRNQRPLIWVRAVDSMWYPIGDRCDWWKHSISQWTFPPLSSQWQHRA